MRSNDTARRERRTITQNGINIYDLKSPGLHGFCLCVYARGGVLYEKERDRGISHYVEHIVFRNINILMGGRLYDILDESGLTFTAATYKEFMQFCITGEITKFQIAADIIIKLFEKLSSEIANGDFELERDRIRAEIREYDEKASLDYLIKSKVWQGTPLAGMITGTLGSVSKITFKRCEEERERIFSRGNFFFYITGNYKESDINVLSEKVGKYVFGEYELRRNICAVPEGFGKRNRELLTKDAGYYMVEMSFDIDTTAYSKESRTLFYDIIFAGENCMFFRELSENMGYIYSYDAKMEEYKNIGNISVSYEVSLKNLNASIMAAAELFKKIKTDASGLKRAKIYYTDNASLALDNAEELNWNMAYDNYILDEKIESIDARRGRYENVTEEDIKEIARGVFRSENLVAGIKGRKKKIDAERITKIFSSLDG